MFLALGLLNSYWAWSARAQDSRQGEIQDVNQLMTFYLKINRWLGLALAIVLGQAGHADNWVSLFDGKTLKGWEKRGGTAEFVVENGTILGTGPKRSPNTFLCTKKSSSNFVLELEFKVDAALNSGVQIRGGVYGEDTEVKKKGSKKKKRHQAGRVRGYQVEIDPDTTRNRMWTGGIYDEARRGWLADLSKNKLARDAFKPEQWNHFRIQAKGDEIKTWINGEFAVMLRDSMDASGFIGLQVHGQNKDKGRAGKQVRWRNIRIKEF